jgi:chromosome segregation ATPase
MTQRSWFQGYSCQSQRLYKGTQISRKQKEAKRGKKGSKQSVCASERMFLSKLKNRNNQPHSFKQRMEQVHRKLKILCENYHGGKFNAVMCQKIMEEAKALIEDLKSLLLDLREQGGEFTVSAESVETKCDTFENLLGQLDAVFSMAKSINGLLPT